ncbi:Zinc finger protein 649 [Myotis brandtii]|uniref:Zinc finger protein 649 n=1 Tax=Myotis brandtii TaxID=109478 RepID=S7MKP8_MYOBR|nr:Zinc finger protein 649 [Myotis brandtii]
MFDLDGKTLKSYLDLIYQSRSCDIREPAEFNGDGRSFLHANHEQTHTEMKFHKSSKPIRTKSQSLKIQETHRIENAYECTESGKAILKKPQLMEHKRIHTGKKPHGCSVWENLFQEVQAH